MLCSLPNGNGDAKSRSAWLDRLHTRNQNQNQNHEAQPQSASPSSSPSPTPTPTPTASASASASPSPSMGDVMSSILADLFVMGNGNPSPAASHPSLRLQSSKGRGRGLRKQPSPKICILSPTPTSAAPTPTSPHLNLNLNLKKKKLLKTKTNPLTVPVSNFKTQNIKKKKKKRLSQPHGRTEATVIDTSTPAWKSPKILIRKGPTFWKILDKKQWNAALTKSKQKHLLHSHKSSHPSDQGDSHEESIDVMQCPVKRPKCSKLPSIPEAAKSIALHLKVRTKGKKKGPSYNNSPKEKVQP